MEVTSLDSFSVLLYGALMFVCTEIVSVPFGAIYKIQELRSVTFSRWTQSWLLLIEYALECAVVIWFTFKASQAQSVVRFLPGFSAFGVAVLVAYPFDVVWAGQSAREFATRVLFGAAFCVPTGFYLAGWSTATF